MESFLDPQLEQTRDETNAWVARFAPLVMEAEVFTEPEVRTKIAVCESLKREGQTLKARLDSLASTDYELVSTFQKALGQLESLETDFRRQLARLNPGDPEGIADLDSINEKLAERLARQEIGAETAMDFPDILDLKVAPGNKAGAAMLGVFGLGWNAFTLFHATLMIGGMAKAFGPMALLLLAFYAIFFFAGFGMWAAAANIASAEHISLEGRSLTVDRSIGPWIRKRKYTLAPDATATIAEVQLAQVNSNRNTKKPTPVVQLTDVEGNPITFGATSTDAQRRQTCDKINAYLKLKG